MTNNVQETPAAAAKRLMREALKGALATLDRETGHPSTSLVTLATLAGNQPVLLISRLAQHTRNLEVDGRASLLFDGTGGLGDPLTGGRLTVIGSAAPTPDPAARARFLARHPGAVQYADFGDFTFYAVTIERAHFVGGFGRIATIAAADLTTRTDDAAALLAAEGDIVDHMNTDHAEALGLYAMLRGEVASEPWRMTGIDPDGIDLVADDAALRIDFEQRITTPAQARAALAQMAKVARAAG